MVLVLGLVRPRLDACVARVVRWQQRHGSRMRIVRRFSSWFVWCWIFDACGASWIAWTWWCKVWRMRTSRVMGCVWIDAPSSWVCLFASLLCFSYLHAWFRGSFVSSISWMHLFFQGWSEHVCLCFLSRVSCRIFPFLSCLLSPIPMHVCPPFPHLPWSRSTLRLRLHRAWVRRRAACDGQAPTLSPPPWDGVSFLSPTPGSGVEGDTHPEREKTPGRRPPETSPDRRVGVGGWEWRRRVSPLVLHRVGGWCGRRSMQECAWRGGVGAGRLGVGHTRGTHVTRKEPTWRTWNTRDRGRSRGKTKTCAVKPGWETPRRETYPNQTQPNDMGQAMDPMEDVFPDALKTLEQADPEMYQLIRKEKERQW